MAISIANLPTNTNHTVFDNDDNTAPSILIQGSPIKVYITLPQIDVNQMNDVETFVKNKLVELLAEEILKNKLCEFTKEKNAYGYETIYRARAFLVPNDQVRKLRENGKI